VRREDTGELKATSGWPSPSWGRAASQEILGNRSRRGRPAVAQLQGRCSGPEYRERSRRRGRDPTARSARSATRS